MAQLKLLKQSLNVQRESVYTNPLGTERESKYTNLSNLPWKPSRLAPLPEIALPLLCPWGCTQRGLRSSDRLSHGSSKLRNRVYLYLPYACRYVLFSFTSTKALICPAMIGDEFQTPRTCWFQSRTSISERKCIPSLPPTSNEEHQCLYGCVPAAKTLRYGL